LASAEAGLEVELNRAESRHRAAHRYYVAHSNFHRDLMIVFCSFEDGEPPEEDVPAGLVEGFVAAVRRNRLALIRDVGQSWSSSLGLIADSFGAGRVTWSSLVPVINEHLTLLSQQTGSDLWYRGQFKVIIKALRLQLAQVRSDCLAARLALRALGVQSRQEPGEFMPREPLPAELPPAEALPASPPPAQSSPAAPSLRRRRRRLRRQPSRSRSDSRPQAWVLGPELVAAFSRSAACEPEAVVAFENSRPLRPQQLLAGP